MSIANAEKSLVNKYLGKYQKPPICMGVARLYLSDDEVYPAWHDPGVWGALLLIIDRENPNRPHYIRLVDLGNPKKTLFQEELYNEMNYATPNIDFHTFEIKESIVGFRFTNSGEAQSFSSYVKRRLGKMMMENQQRESLKAPTRGRQKSWFSRAKGFFGMKEKKREISVGRPTDFKHVSHIGYDPDKGFDVNSIPDSWKKIFKTAGISKKSLKNKQMAQIIFQTIQTSMNPDDLQEGSPSPPISQASAQSAPPPPSSARIPPPRTRVASPPPPKVAAPKGPPSAPLVPQPPPAPITVFAPPPANIPPPPSFGPPVDLPPPPSFGEEKSESKKIGSGPPPPPVLRGSGPPPLGKKKVSVPPSTRRTRSRSRSNPTPAAAPMSLQEAIRKKQMKLKKAEDRPPKEALPLLTENDAEMMVHKLKMKLAEARKNMGNDDDSDNSDSSEWSE
mmetsp:Transcript_1414/g.1999  ORF Transcript_1414/g.1999 Transcript_1414/m.1999 type:complete len:448 (+) Transcript_1414:53-1396(+)